MTEAYVPVGARRVRRRRIRVAWLLLSSGFVLQAAMLANAFFLGRAPEAEGLREKFGLGRAAERSDGTDGTDGTEGTEGTEPLADAAALGGPARSRGAGSIPGRGGSLSHEGGTALWVSRADSLYFASVGGAYERHVALIDRNLESIGAGAAHIRVMPIAGSGPDLLVLSSAYCLSGAQWDALMAFVEGGGGVLVLGAVAVRDERGEWAGWARMNGLLGCSGIVELPREVANFLTVAGVSLADEGDDRGLRVPVNKSDQVQAVAHPDPLAYWSTYGRDHAVGGDAPPAAAIATTRGRGRVLWLGVPIESLPRQEERAYLRSRRWLTSTLSWCAGKTPTAGFGPWPSGADAALLLTQDTELEFANARALAREIASRRLPATFFCVSDLAQKEAGLVGELAGIVEIGSHTDDHQLLVGRTVPEQAIHVRRSKDDLLVLGAPRVVGFRPPEEQYDGATLSALAEEGFTYFIGGNEDHALPDVVWAKAVKGGADRPIVRIPRVADDDFGVASAVGPSGNACALLEEQLRRSVSVDAVHVVSLHTQLFGRPEAVARLRPFLDAIAAHREPAFCQPGLIASVASSARVGRRVWVTTGTALADWWMARARCEIEMRAGDGTGEARLRVVNGGETPVCGLEATFCLPGNPASVSVFESLAPKGAAEGTTPRRGRQVGGSLGADARGTFTLALPELRAREAIEYWIVPADRPALALRDH